MPVHRIFGETVIPSYLPDSSNAKSKISRRIKGERGGFKNGGEGGIRTHDPLARMPVFKTGAINHSATSPKTKKLF
jgi:hypothetical protein